MSSPPSKRIKIEQLEDWDEDIIQSDCDENLDQHELIDNYHANQMESYQVQEASSKDGILLTSFLNGNSNHSIFPLKINSGTSKDCDGVVDVSDYKMVFQVDQFENNKLHDTKFHHYLEIIPPTPPLNSIIQVLSINVKYDVLQVQSYKVLSTSYKYLIHSNTRKQSNRLKKLIKSTTDQFENLLLSNVNGSNREYEISNYLFSNFEKRKQQQQQLDTSNLNELSNYLLSKLNFIIEIGYTTTQYDVEEIYIQVLSSINNLEIINSIHSHYIKICNEYINDESNSSSEYKSIINNLIGLFDYSTWSIKNNIFANEDYQIKVIQNYLNGDNCHGIINEQQLNEGLIMVYDKEVFDYGKTVKSDLYCNSNIFSTDNTRNIKELEFRITEFKSNEKTHPLYKPFYIQPELNGCYSINPKLSLFKKCFSIFTNGIFDQDFNWNGIVNERGEINDGSTSVIVSGSTVLACLDCLPIEIKREYCRIQSIKRLFYKSRLPKILVSKLVAEDELKLNELLFNRFHDIKSPYFDSDIDLWIITDTVEKGKEKLKQVANELLSNLKKKPDFNKDEYTFIRTENAITLVSKYPYRQIQIMITFYRSAKEIISFFDFDCVKSYYDGSNVYMLPRTINSLNTRSNLITGNTKEIRSIKYVMRGFRNIYYKPFKNQIEIKKNKLQKEINSNDCHFDYNLFINLLYSPTDDDFGRLSIRALFNEEIMTLYFSSSKNILDGRKYGNISEYTKFYRRYEPGLEFSETIQSLHSLNLTTNILSISSDLNHLILNSIQEFGTSSYNSFGFGKAGCRFFNINYSTKSKNKEISICNNVDVKQTGIQLAGKCIICDELVEIDSTLNLLNDDIICCIENHVISDINSAFYQPTRSILNQKNVLILGGRNKLGFEVAFNLLNFGFRVTITTRYPDLALKEFQLKFDQHGYSFNLSRLSILQVNFKQQDNNEENESINNFITILKSQFNQDKPIHMFLNFIHLNEKEEDNQFLNSIVPIKITQELSLLKMFNQNSENDNNIYNDNYNEYPTINAIKNFENVFIIYDINGNINLKNIKQNQHINSIFILSPNEIERDRFSILNNNGTTTTLNRDINRIDCFRTIPNSKTSARILIKLLDHLFI